MRKMEQADAVMIGNVIGLLKRAKCFRNLSFEECSGVHQTRFWLIALKKEIETQLSVDAALASAKEIKSKEVEVKSDGKPSETPHTPVPETNVHQGTPNPERSEPKKRRGRPRLERTGSNQAGLAGKDGLGSGKETAPHHQGS